MGLLDDAIREHLELKRRHGADPSEVARQEREALGGPGAPAEAEMATPGPIAPPPEPDAIPEPPVEPLDEAERAGPPAAAGGAVSIDRFEPEPDIDWSTPAPVDEPVAETAPEDEQDVLEETPDFLEETPEHDRLWFEQKPPKDFDF